MGLFDGTERKINKLKGYKEDLGDDYSSIQRYNKHVDSIISDFQSFIKSGYSGVTGKLEDFKEPYQSNDSTLQTACSYIQNEINRLQRSLSEAESES